MFGPTDQDRANDLHELLFLFAAGEARGATPKPRQVGPGLVAAVLMELTELGAVGWAGRRPQVQQVDPFLPPSRTALLHKPIAKRVLEAIETSAQDKPASHWMRALAYDAYELTEAALTSAGMVRRTTRKGLTGSKEVLIVEQSLVPAHLQARVLLIAKGMREVDPTSAALCGLVATLRLEGMVKNYSGSRFASELREVALQYAPHSKEILSQLQDALVFGAQSVRP